MSRLRGLAHSRLFGWLVGPWYIRSLVAGRDVETLVREIDYRKRPRLSLLAVRGLGEIGGEQAISPLVGALADGARRFNDVFAVTFGPLDPPIQSDWQTRVNLAAHLAVHPRCIQARSLLVRRWLYVIMLSIVGSLLGFMAWDQYAPTFPDNEGIWWTILQVLQVVGITLFGLLAGYLLARLLMPQFRRLEVAIARRIKAVGRALFKPLEPTLTMIKGDTATHQLLALDEWFQTIVQALVRIGPPAVDPLIAALQHQKWSVREHTARALGEIKDPRAVEPLLAALRDADLPHLIRAVELLAKVGAPPIEPLVEALQERAPHLQAVVDQAPAQLGSLRAAAVIDAALRNEYWTMLIAAAESLVHSRDIRTVDLMIAALKDKYWNLLAATTEALVKIGDPAAVEPLVSALHEGDDILRQAAARALGKFGDHRAIEAMAALDEVTNQR